MPAAGRALSATVEAIALQGGKESSGGEEFLALERRGCRLDDRFLPIRAISPAADERYSECFFQRLWRPRQATALMEARHLRGFQRRSTASAEPGATVDRWRSALLSCGILASVLYVAMTLFVGLLWEGYSVASNVPSELSAIGAPTRALWILLGTVYGVLMIAFGWIVWASAPPNRALRAVGALLVAHTAFGQFWPPMHQRAVLAAGGGTLTDTLHLVWAAVTGIFFMLIVALGAAALGKRFRLYSIATMAIVLACGAVTGTYAADVQADLPTPWVGIWERISIATFMAWIVVLAIALLRAPRGATPSVRHCGGGRST